MDLESLVANLHALEQPLLDVGDAGGRHDRGQHAFMGVDVIADGAGLDRAGPDADLTFPPTSHYSEIILASKDYRWKCARSNKAGFCCNPSPQPGLAEGFNPTSSVSPSRRLPPSRLHHTTRVQIAAGPNELRVAHILPQIIRFFTLFRRHRYTPNEY